MQETLNCIRFVHVADPGTETSIRQTISKSADGIAHNKSRIWRMRSKDSKRDEMADRCHNGHTSLAKEDVDAGIGEGGDRVANKRSEED